MVTLYFAGGSGHYKAPLHIAAKAEADLDVMELIMMQQPDADGNVIPMDAMQGSAMVSGPKDVTDPIDVTLSLAVFNPTTAVCSTGCTNCNGFSSLEITDNPFAVAVSATHQLTATAYYSNGTPYNKTSVATWSSNNTAVATVSSGLVNGIAVGSPTISAFVDLDAVGQACQGQFDENGNPVRCPLSQEFAANSPGTVQVPTSLNVLNVSVLPTQSTGDFGCLPSADYGIMIDIKYQVLDQNQVALQSAGMVPHESGSLDGQLYDNDIGPTRISTTSKNTAADGTFHDAPLGACSPFPISAPGTNQTQTITIILNGTSYTVRSQTFHVTAPFNNGNGIGHGSITNNSDISASR